MGKKTREANKAKEKERAKIAKGVFGAIAVGATIGLASFLYWLKGDYAVEGSTPQTEISVQESHSPSGSIDDVVSVLSDKFEGLRFESIEQEQAIQIKYITLPQNLDSLTPEQHMVKYSSFFNHYSEIKEIVSELEKKGYIVLKKIDKSTQAKINLPMSQITEIKKLHYEYLGISKKIIEIEKQNGEVPKDLKDKSINYQLAIGSYKAALKLSLKEGWSLLASLLGTEPNKDGILSYGCLKGGSILITPSSYK